MEEQFPSGPRGRKLPAASAGGQAPRVPAQPLGSLAAARTERAREDAPVQVEWPHFDEEQPPTRGETPEGARERVNRRWNEVLQETRVALTGVQVLFGFLLSVAFTERFEDLQAFDRTVYLVTVVLGSAAIGALIAPVSIHRFLSGQRMKDEVVEAAGRLMMCGIVLVALTVGATLLLLLHVVLDSLLAEILTGAVMVWFAACWYVLPVWLRNRAARNTPPEP